MSKYDVIIMTVLELCVSLLQMLKITKVREEQKQYKKLAIALILSGKDQHGSWSQSLIKFWHPLESFYVNSSKCIKQLSWI